MSHLLVLQEIMTNEMIMPYEYVIIFEDDAMCCENFELNYHKFMQEKALFAGDLVYIGGRFAPKKSDHHG
jgi:GR25 family glycosyltransferase involved in LPS biosynthesis